ncbi:MAG: hypothetical protein HEQ22_11040 [Sphingopyxis sp.]|uniref:hypothetical protein n=1 Tax=Sphingopyxis sp. TaxID=1908224 RepID=UPI003D80C81F
MEKLLKVLAILAGVLAAFFSTVPMIGLLVCPGFFEAGCGTNESPRLAAALLASAIVGILVCWLCHRLITIARR